jgi:hypothetical protein
MQRAIDGQSADAAVKNADWKVLIQGGRVFVSLKEL